MPFDPQRPQQGHSQHMQALRTFHGNFSVLGRCNMMIVAHSIVLIDWTFVRERTRARGFYHGTSAMIENCPIRTIECATIIMLHLPSTEKLPWNVLSACTICVRRATRMAAARGLEASKFRLEDEAHLNLQYEHRLYYYKHRELGCRSGAFAPERAAG